jgi:hypothetical protein
MAASRPAQPRNTTPCKAWLRGREWAWAQTTVQSVWTVYGQCGHSDTATLLKNHAANQAMQHKTVALVAAEPLTSEDDH